MFEIFTAIKIYEVILINKFNRLVNIIQKKVTMLKEDRKVFICTCDITYVFMLVNSTNLIFRVKMILQDHNGHSGLTIHAKNKIGF